MRVLILSHYYDPEPIPKPAELARALKRKGHSVYVLTGFPNYPSGKLYSGFHLSLFRREERDGISVLRTFQLPYHGRSSLGRVLNYLSFMVSSVLGAGLIPRCDVMYVWHPPLTVGLAAAIIGFIKGIPFVYDVQDIWPESIIASGWKLPAAIVWILHRMEQVVYKRANRILVVTEKAKENLVRKGAAPTKVVPIPHWFDDTLFRAARRTLRDIRSEYKITERFVVIFAGNLGLMQGLDMLVGAAEKLRSYKDILFVLVGDGVDRSRLQSMVSGLGLENVLFVDRQPLSGMPSFLSAADLLLVLLKDSQLSECIIPTKTFAYMAAGKPILAAANGACAALVRDAGAGVAVSPDNVSELVEGVLQFYAMPGSSRSAIGERGRTYLLNHFSKEKVTAEYEKVLLTVAHRAEAGRSVT